MRTLKEIEYMRPLYYFAIPGILIGIIGLFIYLNFMQNFYPGGNLDLTRAFLTILLTITGMFMVFIGITLHEISKLLSYLKCSRRDFIE
jgi:polyferredoxin